MYTPLLGIIIRNSIMSAHITSMSPTYLPDTSKRYSQGMIVSGENLKWIILSGQVAVDENGKPVFAGNMGGQADYIFKNIVRLLHDANATTDDVVKINIFTTDISRFHEIAEARDRYFTGRKPTSLVAEVRGLILPEILMEIEVTAVI
jgi:2-iminobutanoate/2-iminopropanoate deaminase